MAKRQVVECDLTKQEVEDAGSLVTITIKAEGKKPRSYDLSAEAAAKLEAQLTATRDHKLDPNWFFANGKVANPVPRVSLDDLTNQVEDAQSKRENPPDDDDWVSERKQELRKTGRTRKKEEKKEDVAIEVIANDDGSGCPHMNKGRVRMEIRADQQYAYHVCRDCGTELPAMTKDQKQAFLNGKPPADVNIRDISK